MFPNSQNILITGGTFNHHYHAGEDRGIDLLLKASAPAAFHDSGHQFDAPKCHPNTRVAILARIMDWIIGQGDWDRFIVWIYGPAGSGKSAIGRTIAERCHAQKRLLAGFFFSRSDASRNNLNSFIASLAYQIAINLPSCRALIEAAVENDPAIFKRSLKTQFTVLIIDPLLAVSQSGAFKKDTSQPAISTGSIKSQFTSWIINPLLSAFQSGTFKSTSPSLLIIDGLDECDPSVRFSVLDVISTSLSHSQLPLKFLIASRPEPDILLAFSSSTLDNITNRLALDDSYRPDVDIKQFLSDSFMEIRSKHPLKNFIPTIWPTDHDISTLVTKSSGQFIYAATVVKYVSTIRRRPTDQLEVILGLRPSQLESPFAELDALYRDILSTVGNITMVLKLLGILVLPGMAPQEYLRDYTSDNSIFMVNDLIKVPDFLEQFLVLNPGNVHCLLIDLSSILDYKDEKSTIRMLHASFADYLFDSSRSREYHVDPGAVHTELAQTCLKWIKMKSTGNIAKYIASQLLFHCSNANPTEGLRGDLLNADVIRNLSDFKFWVTPDFISFLKSSIFSKPHELYLCQLWILLDKILHSKLNNFCSKQFIMIYTVFTDLDIFQTPRFLSLQETIKEMASEISSVDVATEARLNVFGIGHEPPIDDFPHLNMLYDFFTDLDRAGHYFLDGTKYAEAAVLFLKYISTPSRELPAHTLLGMLDVLEKLVFKSSYSKQLRVMATTIICLRTRATTQRDNDIYKRLVPDQLRKVKNAIGGCWRRTRQGPAPQICITLEFLDVLPGVRRGGPTRMNGAFLERSK